MINHVTNYEQTCDDKLDTTQPDPSQRAKKPTWKVLDNNERGIRLYATYYESMHVDDYQLQDQMSDPISFLSKTNDDPMNNHQAMKQLDSHKFHETIVKEIQDYCKKQH